MGRKLCTSLTSNTLIYCEDRVRELLKMEPGDDLKAGQGEGKPPVIVNSNKVVVNVVTGTDGAEKDGNDGIPVELVVVGVLVGLLLLSLCCLARRCYKKSQRNQGEVKPSPSLSSLGSRSNSSTWSGPSTTASSGTWSVSSSGVGSSTGSRTSSRSSSSSNSEARGVRFSAEGQSSSERDHPEPVVKSTTNSSGYASGSSSSSASTSSSSSSGRSSATSSSWSGSSDSSGSSDTWATGSSTSGSGRLSNLSSTLAHAVPSANSDGYTPVFATKHPR